MHKLLKLYPAFLLLAFILVPSAEARADAVAVTSGNFIISSPFRTIPRYISFGFDLNGNNFRASGGQVDGPSQHVGSNCPSPCAAGSTFSLSSTNGLSLDKTGLLVVDGQQHIGFFFDALTFNSGPVTIPLDAPTVIGQTFSLTTTFTMTGTVGFSEFDVEHGVFPGFNYNTAVFGSGSATIDLFFSAITHDFQIAGVRYDFQAAATPEPATLILLGTGLAGLVGGARRRRKRLRGAADLKNNAGGNR